jgi:hypothetical protein
MVYILLCLLLIIAFYPIKNPEIELIEYSIDIAKKNNAVGTENSRMLKSLEESNKRILDIIEKSQQK